MYELSVDTHFSAAHRLDGYDGICARLHGHTWKVTLTLGAETVGPLGMSMDFKEIELLLDSVVARFDHQTLNDMEEFRSINPTAENLARLLFDTFTELVNKSGISVLSVTVTESERTRVVYRKE